MTQVRSWLPAEAVQRGVRDVALRSCVRGWAAAWFAAGQADLSGDPTLARQSRTERGTVWQLADDVVVTLASDADERLVALMFGTPDEATALTAADRRMLDAAVQDCVADLRTRLTTLLRLEGVAAWRPGAPELGAAASWSWRVSDGRGATVLEIALSEELVVRRIRAGLPPMPARPDLPPLAVALSGQAVTVSALVGRGRLTTTELAGLASGDVLLLDRDLEGAVEIAVEYRPKPLRCTVDRQDDRLQITIV